MYDILCKKLSYIEKKKKEIDIKYLNKKKISKKEKEILKKYGEIYYNELINLEHELNEYNNYMN